MLPPPHLHIISPHYYHEQTYETLLALPVLMSIHNDLICCNRCDLWDGQSESCSLLGIQLNEPHRSVNPLFWQHWVAPVSDLDITLSFSGTIHLTSIRHSCIITVQQISAKERGKETHTHARALTLTCARTHTPTRAAAADGSLIVLSATVMKPEMLLKPPNRIRRGDNSQL